MTARNKVDALTKAISNQSESLKSAWKNMSVFSRASIIVAGITLVANAIEGIVSLFDSWEDKVERFETQISENDIKIANYDAEISELESLQSALVDAKDDKVKLASIYDDLNDKIAVSTGLINGETDAWESANSAIEAQIAINKKLRENAVSENIQAYEGIFNTKGIDRTAFGLDFLARDLSGDTLRAYAQEIAQIQTLGIGDASSHSLADFLNRGLLSQRTGVDVSVIQKELNEGSITLDEAKNKLVEQLMASYNLTSSDWATFWNDQVNTAYKALDMAIEDYEGYGGKSFAKQLINSSIRNGYGLEETKSFLNQFNTDELQNAISDFQDSLLNPNLDSAAAAKGISEYFDGIKEEFPLMIDFLDDYEEIIISSYKGLGDSINKASRDLHRQFEDSGNIEDSFEDIQKYLSSLDASELDTVTRMIASGLMDDVNTLEQLEGKLGVLEDLRLSIVGVADGFNSAAAARNKFQEAMGGVIEYDTNFKSYNDAYNTLKAQIDAGTMGSKTAQTAIEYLLGEGASGQYTNDQIEDMVKNGSLKTMYANAETYGTGLLEMLSKIDKESAGIVNSWAKLNKDGSFDFDIDIDEVDELAKALGTTEDGVWSMIEALQMYGDIQLFDVDDIVEYGTQLGAMSELAGKKIVNVDTLLEGLGLDISQASNALSEMEKQGYILLNSSDSAEELCEKLSNIGAVSGDAANGFSGNVSQIVDSLKKLGYEDEAIGVILGKLTKLQETGSITLSFDIDESILKPLDGEKKKIFYEFVATNYDGFIALTDEEKKIVVDLIANGEDVDAWLDRKENVKLIAQITGAEDIDSLYAELANFDDATIEVVAAVLGKAEIEDLANEFKELDDKEVKAIVTAMGKGDVEGLSEAIDNLDDKTVQAIAKALGYSDVSDLYAAIGKLDSKTVQAIAEALGISDVKSLRGAIDRVTSKEVSVKAETSGITKISNLASVIKSLRSKTVTVAVVAEGVQKVKNAISAITGHTRLKGTAHIKGTAFTNGNIGAKDDETALMSEHKPEIWVHANTGNWELVERPQFGKVRKGDIIFNGEQTEELLKQGYTGTFGKAFLSGTVSGKGDSDNSSSNGTNNNSSSSSSKSESSTEVDPKKVDWITIAIERLSRAIDKLKNVATSVFSSLSTKLSSTEEEIAKTTELISLQSQAYKRYMDEANSVSLPNTIKAKVRDGAIDISEYDEETAELITTYQELYEKALGASDAIDELHISLAELYVRNFDDIQNDYDSQLGLLEHLTNTYNTGIDALEAKGYLASTNYYAALQNVEKQNIAVLEKQLADMTAAFSAAMSSGEIEAYSEEWYSMQSDINGVKERLQEANVAVLDFAKSMRQVEWDHFDYLQERISYLTDEANFLIELMSSSKLHNDTGGLTDKGLATAGLHGQNYNVYMEQAALYAAERAKLEAEILNTPNDADLIARRYEIIKLQQESILAAEQEKQAIADLIKDGYDKELESMQNLVDKYKSVLDNAKDLYEYQKRIAEQTKTISAIEKQLSAYEGDDSEENKARVQRLRMGLEEAQQNLKDTEYDKYISDQQKLLDSLYLEYEQNINSRMDNIDALVESAIQSVNANGEAVSATLQEVSSSVGYQMTSEMQSIWNGANNILTMYQQGVAGNLTTIINVLGDIRSRVQGMINASNAEADSVISSATPVTQPTIVTPPATNTPNKDTGTDNKPVAAIAVGKKINAGNAKIYDYVGDKSGEKQYYSKDPIYTVLKEQNGWIQVRYHKLSSGITGWFKKSDVKAYKTGGLVDYTGLAWVDGTPNKPETILNSEDSANFIALRDLLRKISDSGASFNSSDNSSSAHLKSLSTEISKPLANITKINNAGGVRDINISIPIDHVSDYNDFVTQLREDKQFEKLVQAMSIDLLDGKSSMSKNKYRW